jgi:cytochrome P450
LNWHPLDGAPSTIEVYQPWIQYLGNGRVACAGHYGADDPIGARDQSIDLHTFDVRVARKGRPAKLWVEREFDPATRRFRNAYTVSLTADGKPLADKEVFGFVCFLFIAGLDTVFATLNNIWLWLAEHPERRREIIERMDGDIDKIVEELLRRYAVTFSGREVAQDITMRGVELKKGDRITCILPACNLDPEAFPDPLSVDFDRPRKTILAFTVGVHSCMGAHLARLEVKIALEEWLKRIPDFAVKPGTDLVYKPGGVVGPEYVPLQW